MFFRELHQWDTLQPTTLSEDPLKWWKQNSALYPVLAELAQKYLAVPASQCTTERAFSTAGNIVTSDRASFLPERVEALALLQKNRDFSSWDFDPACCDEL